MHVAHVVQEIMIVLAASLVAVWVLARAKLPSIVGFLVAGIVIGPRGLGWVKDKELVDVMAEVGVVLLMFTIGLKFSIAELARMKGLVFGAGTLQMVVTIGALTGIGAAFGIPVPKAAFLGFLVSMSSTAIVLKLLEERAESDAPHGRLATGVLIMQDLAVVPLMLLTPMLAGRGGTPLEATLELLKAFGLVAVVLFVAKFVLPRFFGLVARTRSREVFTLATILVILATAAATGVAGLSLALGALVAGVVLSESDFANQALSDVVPLRDLLASLFFVSVGMLVDVRGWVAEPVLTAGLTAATFALKALIIWGIARAFGLGPRIAVLAGIAIGQIGEFAFVLALEGQKFDLLDGPTYQRFLSVSVLTMAATPFLLLLSPWIAGKAAAVAGAGGHGHGEHAVRKDHVIVVGFGVTGRNVATVLKPLGVPLLVIELNLRTVKAIRAAFGDAQYGDASREEVLVAAGIHKARALVISALDPVSTRQAVATARRLNRDLHILVRTRYVGEMTELHRLGANVVVPEEFEASIALATQVMKHFGAGEHAVARAQSALRGDDYSLLAAEMPEDVRTKALAGVLSGADFVEVPVPERFVGATLRSLELGSKTGALAVAIRSGGELTPNPRADRPLAAGDALVVLGSPDALREVNALFA